MSVVKTIVIFNVLTEFFKFFLSLQWSVDYTIPWWSIEASDHIIHQKTRGQPKPADAAEIYNPFPNEQNTNHPTQSSLTIFFVEFSPALWPSQAFRKYGGTAAAEAAKNNNNDNDSTTIIPLLAIMLIIESQGESDTN